MEYITHKHKLGLAIITWSIDDDCDEEDYEHYYHIDVCVYNMDNECVHEDCRGHNYVESQDGMMDFEREILEHAKELMGE